MAALNYLGNKSWSDITREERYYCSHLYNNVLGKEKEFIDWINKNASKKSDPNYKLTLPLDVKWELGYEVCFYRDLIKDYGLSIKNYNKTAEEQFLQKRTFDLCLFSEKNILIIEAKVQQGFSVSQIDEIENDKKQVLAVLKKNPKLIGPININVEVLLLYSSEYTPRNNKILMLPNITWEQLQKTKFEKNKIFEFANKKYGR